MTCAHENVIAREITSNRFQLSEDIRVKHAHAGSALIL